MVGGHKHEFSQVQGIYQIAEAARIGECTVAVPDTLLKILGPAEIGHFLPATVSGSLARAGLGALLQLAGEYDGVVVGANLTNNSETGILVESLVSKLEGRLIFTDEAVEILKFNPSLITGNPRALVATNMAGLFKLANHHRLPIAIKPGSGLMGKLEILKQLSDISRCAYFICDQEVMVAAEGKLSVTPMAKSLSDVQAVAVGIAAAFFLQNSKLFEGLTAGAFVCAQVSGGARGVAISTAAKALPDMLSKLEE